MDYTALLPFLKMDLQMMTDKLDARLLLLLSAAAQMITREGIVLEGSAEDQSIVIMYAAYLYRKRAEEHAPMPRMLRWALNNRLLSQKAKGG